MPNLGLFLARGGDGAVRVFHNVCRHRGHPLVSAAKPGCRQIVCPYHGWRYDLSGALRSVSQFAGTEGGLPEGLDPAEFGLKGVRSEVWLDWIFVNLDGSAPPLQNHLAPLLQRLDGVNLAQLRPFHDLEHGEVAANWKLVMENSLEPYHTPMIHPETGAGIPLDRHHMIVEEGLLGCAVEVASGTATPLSDGSVAVTSEFLALPPLFIFVLYGDSVVLVHRNLPSRERPDRTWRSVHLYDIGETPLSAEEMAEWRRLEYRIHVEEDGPVYEALQQSKLSPASDDGGLLSPAWETTVQAFYQAWAANLEEV